MHRPHNHSAPDAALEITTPAMDVEVFDYCRADIALDPNPALGVSDAVAPTQHAVKTYVDGVLIEGNFATVEQGMLAENAVPQTRTINGQALTHDLIIGATGGFITKFYFDGTSMTGADANPKPWDPATTYSAGQVVSYQASASNILRDYRALRESTGVTPSVGDDWALEWHNLESSPSATGSFVRQSDAVSSGTPVTELDRFVMPALGRTSLDGGDWVFSAWVHVSGTASPSAQIKMELYRVKADGTFSDAGYGVFASGLSNTFTTVVSARTEVAVFSVEQSTWEATDMVGVVVSCRRMAGTNTRVTFTSDKTSDKVSNVESPQVLRHNDMEGLNVGNYQHLTDAQKTVVTRAASITQSGYMTAEQAQTLAAGGVLDAVAATAPLSVTAVSNKTQTVSIAASSTTSSGSSPQAVAPSAGQRNVLAIDNEELSRSDKALLGDAAPSALGSASAGSALTAARSDHTHAMPSAANVGAAAADHVQTVTAGGTGLTVIPDGSVLAANAENTLSAITWHEAGTKVLTNVSGTIGWGEYSTVPSTITVANEASDTTCFPSFFTASTGNAGPKTSAFLTFDSATGALGATTFNGLSLASAAVGFTISGGTDSKTLTVTTSGTLGSAAYTASGDYAADNHTQAVTAGGTGLTTIPTGSVLVANESNTLAAITWTSAGDKVLTNKSGVISWETVVVADPHAAVTLAASVSDVLSLSTQSIGAVDAGADRIVFWDESESKLSHLTVGTGLAVAGTTITTSLGYTIFYSVTPPLSPANNDRWVNTATLGEYLRIDNVWVAFPYAPAPYGDHNHDTAYEPLGAVANHAAITTGVHGLAITTGQTLTVPVGGTISSAAFSADTAFVAATGGTVINGTITGTLEIDSTMITFGVGAAAALVAAAGATPAADFLTLRNMALLGL